jgi:outer membrane protein assembly factor BamB
MEEPVRILTRVATLVLTSLMLLSGAAAMAAENAAGLMEKTGIRGGLCLVAGAKDLALANAMVAGSTLYVQVLQPDAKLATAWGAAVATAANRERIGIRNAAFDAEHYGSDLFNLIVVEDAAALGPLDKLGAGKAKLADLSRILVPNGVVAFKSAPAGLAAEAKALGMRADTSGAFAAAYRKPVKPMEWKVCDSVKWKAGAGGVGECAEIAVTNGTLVYADRFESPGDLTALDGRYVVRDAYNGRTLSSEPLGNRKPNWYPPNVAKTLSPVKPAPSSPWEERGQGGGWKAVKERTDGKTDLPFFGGHCYKPVQLGKYVVYHHNIWVNTETNERNYPHFLHPACAYGLVPGNGVIYNFPSSKPQAIAGITALAPADTAFDHEPGGKVLQTFGAALPGEPATSNDWPMFRASPARGNSCAATPGDKPVKVWEARLGLETKSYGVMSGERTGLTQPVSAWGFVIVADIDSERIVALDVADGSQKWVFHVGSRVDFSPTLYNGLCLFAARNGWVYCLDAQKGTLIWRMLVPTRERAIGWQEKLGNLWPTRSDVPIFNGIGYAAAGLGFATLGGVRVVAFKPETGEPVWSHCYFEELGASERQVTADLFTWRTWRGRPLMKMGPCTIDMATGTKSPDLQGGLTHNFDGYLDVGNSLPRTMADIGGYLLSDGRVRGRMIAFSDDLSVAYTVSWGGVTWEACNQDRKTPVKMNLMAANDPKTPLWKSPDIELVVDDIVLTPQRIYCVGHYQRAKKTPELWVLAREDGQVISTVPVEGYPAFMGMSAAGNRLFISTREGKLISYQGAK